MTQFFKPRFIENYNNLVKQLLYSYPDYNDELTKINNYYTV